ncbi:type VI secretion system baseplate subunit TssE [Limoniibacter endophyticus]|uniref:Type VI secretion protein n=1 Tax=Limoniibacter endophyticus TaxID=1565040 RepID=A0A8J3DP06_9HYPH|nr:type VI secretion system baseplate subunit TssE [Limoniibacter endophyticus]GHC69517.1 type VI secretion protein [Limoniibacter endophyticus]
MADHPLERYRAKDRILARSLLDRLLDDAPDQAQDQPLTIPQQVREMREALRRDLEALLNTRRNPVGAPTELTELRDALVNYGVDGLVSVNLATDQAKLQLAHAIERRIALFEPRLQDVSVTILKRNAHERALRMRIEGTFRLWDDMPPISFESTIDPSNQRISVEAQNG